MARQVVVFGNRSGSMVGRIVEEGGEYFFQEVVKIDYEAQFEEPSMPKSVHAAFQYIGKMFDDHGNGKPMCAACADQKKIAQGKRMVLGFPVNFSGPGQYYSIPEELTSTFPELKEATDGTGKCRVGYYTLPDKWFFQQTLVPPGGNLGS